MNTKIYIGNLPYSLADDQLNNLFSTFGDITDLIIIKDRETGRSRGFGFITFDNQASAQEALSMNQQDVEGKKIIVNMAKPQDKRAGGGRRSGGGGRNGGGGGGFRGSRF